MTYCIPNAVHSVANRTLVALGIFYIVHAPRVNNILKAIKDENFVTT